MDFFWLGVVTIARWGRHIDTGGDANADLGTFEPVCAASGVGRGSALRNRLLFLEAGPHSLEGLPQRGTASLTGSPDIGQGAKLAAPSSRDARKGQHGSHWNSRVVLDNEAKGT
jgi:hypothetical protein